MEAINILVTNPFPEQLIEKLSNVSPRLNVIQHEAQNEGDLPDNIEMFDVLYTSGALPHPNVARRLNWVQLHSAGVNHIHGDPLFTDSDIIFTTTSGIHAVNIAEYVMAQMLAFGHHIPKMVLDKQDREWTGSRWGRYVPRELRGKTLGVVGYGSIGREVARLARAFGMSVLAIKRDLRILDEASFRQEDTGDPAAEIPDRIYPVTAIKSVMRASDYVVVTTPLTEQTYHLIDRVVIGSMKQDAILINVARGAVIDEAALINALEKGEIGGAGLDVFEEEPLPEDSPLWDLENVILSPHVSGFTPDYDERATDLFAENLRRFIIGEALINEVKRVRGY